VYELVPGVKLVLASASPRRQEMLSRLGIRYRTAPASVDEALLPAEDAPHAVKRLARLKAQAVAAAWPGRAVLAADTLVTLDNRVLGKPDNPAHARRMLASLSGRTHQVVTGFCLLGLGRTDCGLARSNVRFRQITPEEIVAYVTSNEPMGKAGAYAVQGLGAALVERVSGSYTNVVGLPLAAVIKLMLGRGLIQPRLEDHP
jgi:septum formation protein